MASWLKAVTILGVALAVGCNQTSSSNALGSAELLQAADELGKLLQDAQKSADFAPKVRVLGSIKAGSLTGSLTKRMSDQSFIFNGQQFSRLKTQMEKQSKTLNKIDILDKNFRSLNDMFAARGIGGRVNGTDIKAYLNVANASLRALSKGQTKGADFDAQTLARALRVVVVLAAVPTKTAGAGLNLDKTTVDVDFCGAFNSAATANRSWICAKDDIGGAIGYMAAGQDKVWVDAFADKTFPACPEGAISSDGESWGWIADANAPGGGRSCHRDIPIKPDAVSTLCKHPSAADFDSGDCKKAQDSGDKGGSSGATSGAPAGDDDEDYED